MNAVSNKYKTNNSPSKYLTEFIEKKIHHRYKGIDIYTLSDSYISNQRVDVYMNKNSQLSNNDLYVEIFDGTNNISMIQKHTEINDDFLMFSTNIVNPGHYNVVGFYDPFIRSEFSMLEEHIKMLLGKI